MESVNPPTMPSGKFFAALYSLYAGLVSMFVVDLLLAPVAHRILHQFLWCDSSSEAAVAMSRMG